MQPTLTRRRALGVLGLVGLGTTSAAASRAVDATPSQPELAAELEYTDEEPPLDGSPTGPWADVEEHEFQHVVQGGDEPDPEDFSGHWRGLWDERALYLFVEVVDEEPVVEPDDGNAIYHDDLVEVYLDGDHSRDPSYDGENDAEYGFRPGDEEVWTGVDSIENTAGIEFTQVETDAGYDSAIAIPWETLGVAAWTGKRLGIDVHINDDDTGGDRDHKLTWYDTEDLTWQASERMASVELVGGDVPEPGDEGSSDDESQSDDESRSDDESTGDESSDDSTGDDSSTDEDDGSTADGSESDDDGSESTGDDEEDDTPGFGLGAAVAATVGAALARARIDPD